MTRFISEAERKARERQRRAAEHLPRSWGFIVNEAKFAELDPALLEASRASYVRYVTNAELGIGK